MAELCAFEAKIHCEDVVVVLKLKTEKVVL